MDSEADNEVTMNFHEMGLDDRILEAIARLGWEKPTLIQEKAIPYFLKGKDIFARARTGSGKTGSFLVPLIHKILEKRVNLNKQVTSTLILTPSKELCKQITEHIQQLTSFCKREVSSIDLSQQVPLDAQKSLLADNPDIVVGTPLKILEHLNEKNLDLTQNLQYLIIDEADLMFAFDYEKNLKEVFRYLPTICQSFITSATLPDDVKALKSLILHNPVVLKLEEPPLPCGEQLTQYVVKVEDFDKIVLLYALLKMNLIRGKTLIFVNTVDKGYKIRIFLQMFGITSCILNSELPVNSRCHIVDEFNRGKYTLLIASDEKTVMNPQVVKEDGTRKRKRKRDHESGVSRGIDFQFISNVVNFDFPDNADAYVHRVGRTARGNMEGTALSMVSSNELKTFKKVQSHLKKLMNLSTDAVFKDYKFNMASLDGFRYRANDVWKQCTNVAVRDCRKKEIKAELLKSQKLKSFFEDHPKDLEVIRHDVVGKSVAMQAHLQNVPEYNVPAALKRVATASKRIKQNWRKPASAAGQESKSKARYLRMKKDPLRSLIFDEFNKSK